MSDRIGFSTSNALLSRVIRAFTGSAVSHTFLVYYDVDFQEELVLEATLQGLRLVPYTQFKQHSRIIKEVTPQHDLTKGFRHAGSMLGRWYDFAGVFGMLWVLLGRYLRRKWRNPWGSPSAFFCSEFIARVLIWSDYPGCGYWDPETITPDDLLEFFMKEEIHRETEEHT